MRRFVGCFVSGLIVLSLFGIQCCIWLQELFPESEYQLKTHRILDLELPIVTHSFAKAGTGNTLFFIASIIGIAALNGRQAALSKRIPLLQTRHLNLPILDSGSLKTFKLIQDSGVGIYNKKYENLTSLVGGKNIYFAGYLQSYKYFHKYKHVILQQFQFSDEISSEAERLIQGVTAGISPITLVGIHVRRGDFLKNSNTRKLHRTAPKEYFLKVMESFRSGEQKVLFLVVSDSLDWCKATLNASDVRFLRGSHAEVDMKILSSMDHLILSTGTFGWWSAYLSSAKSITYYKHWYNSDTETGRKFRPGDFFPPEWNGIE